MELYMPRLKSQFAMLIIKPEGLDFEGRIKDYLIDRSFEVYRRYSIVLPEEKLREVYQNVTDPTWTGLDRYVAYMISIPTVTLFLVYENCTPDAQAVLKSFIGHKNPTKAPLDSLRGTLRGLMEKKFGNLYVENGDFWLNGVHAAKDSREAGIEAAVLFGDDIRDFLTDS
jgi:nucleoside diphosphate kinase